jgi:hypothetical protein
MSVGLTSPDKLPVHHSKTHPPDPAKGSSSDLKHHPKSYPNQRPKYNPFFQFSDAHPPSSDPITIDDDMCHSGRAHVTKSPDKLSALDMEFGVLSMGRAGVEDETVGVEDDETAGVVSVVDEDKEGDDDEHPVDPFYNVSSPASPLDPAFSKASGGNSARLATSNAAPDAAAAPPAAASPAAAMSTTSTAAIAASSAPAGLAAATSTVSAGLPATLEATAVQTTLTVAIPAAIPATSVATEQDILFQNTSAGTVLTTRATDIPVISTFVDPTTSTAGTFPATSTYSSTKDHLTTSPTAASATLLAGMSTTLTTASSPPPALNPATTTTDANALPGLLLK